MDRAENSFAGTLDRPNAVSYIQDMGRGLAPPERERPEMKDLQIALHEVTSPQNAQRIMSLTVEQLEKAIADFGNVPNKTPMQQGLVDAAVIALAHRKQAA